MIMSGFGLNKVFIMGNLTRDPDLRQLSSGQAVCKLGIATSRTTKGKNGGSDIQEVCFVDVDVWGNQAETCKKVLDKGSSVLVEGRLKWDSWTDANGSKKSRHTIIADRVTFIKTNSKSGDELNSLNKGEISLDDEEAFKEDLPF